MTPPEVCLNCHGGSYTTGFDPFEAAGSCVPPEGGEPAHLDCLQRLGPDLFRRDPVMREHWRRLMEEWVVPDTWNSSFPAYRLPPVTSTDDVDPCPAQSRWPEWLRTPHPEGQLRPWWVRGNYEALRETPAPFRIDVERATITADAELRSGAALPLVRGWVDLLAGNEARVSSSLSVVHNQLDLLLTRLLEFQNVEVDHPVGEIPLNRISTGDFGGLHAITTVPTWMMFFIEPFMVPHPPPGYDHQTYEQFLNTASYYELLDQCTSPSFAYEQAGICPQPMLYPDRRHSTSSWDLNLWALLPDSLQCRLGGLVNEEERLPPFFNLEDLIRVIRGMPARECPAGGGGGMTMDEILNFVRSGTLSIHLEELNDFFLPGVLDLGPSSGMLRVHLSEERRIDAVLEDFEIEVEGMGYGVSRCAGPDASLRPSVQLHWATITPGTVTEFDPFLDPEIPPPGIYLTYDLQRGSLVLHANLHIHGEVTLPFLGPAYFEADVRATLNAERDETGLRLVAGENSLHVANLTLHRPDEDDAIVSALQIDVSDDGAGVIPAARFALAGRVMGRTVELAGDLPLSLDIGGFYDWSTWEAGWELAGNARITGRGGEEILSEFGFHSEPVEEDGLYLPSSRDYEMSFEAVRHLAARRPTVHPLIEDGRLEWSRLRESECGEQDHVTLTADLFRWGELILNGVLLRVIADEISISPTESHFRIADLTVAANGAGSSTGPVRGEVRLEQNPERQLDFIWMGPERRLTMSGLDLAITAQRLYALPDALLRGLNPRVASLGIDGNLSGGLDMFFPHNPRCIHGDGELLLRGDRDGDIYFLDGRGRRVGAPLFRDTRWRFSRVDWVNTERGYALGRFRLDTILNLSAAPNYSAPVYYPETSWIDEDLRAGVLGPYELSASMIYNNQPIFPEHFRNRIADYLLNVYLSPDATFDSASTRLPRECRAGEGGSR